MLLVRPLETPISLVLSNPFPHLLHLFALKFIFAQPTLPFSFFGAAFSTKQHERLVLNFPAKRVVFVADFYPPTGFLPLVFTPPPPHI